MSDDIEYEIDPEVEQPETILRVNFLPEGEWRIVQIPVGRGAEVVIEPRLDYDAGTITLDVTTGLEKHELLEILELIVEGLKASGEPVEVTDQ